ncbi:MAG TPA: acetylornithine deacetylase [Candidatus Acidoferrum sp.]|nr:acetylornithine deacetylase [Candidatus Acidoferrum sp.]
MSLTPLDLIRRLVGFDTVSAHSNLALIHYVRDYLGEFGVESRLTFDADRSKANLLAAIGPDLPGGIVLSGHTDVVPVAGQPWQSDPFTVVERDGRLYGRGTADMKSFLAIALALVPELRAARLRVPIYLALSYDEEVGCLGVGRLLNDLAAALPRPAAAIIGEPTSMKLINRHKGFQSFTTTVSGRDGHSSGTHRGVNAIAYASEIVAFLSGLAAEIAEQGPLDDGFDPPYTTINVGAIRGGTAVNIIARQCSFDWEFRPIPGFDIPSVRRRLDSFVAESILPRMRAVASESDVTTVQDSGSPPLVPEADSPAEALVRLLTGANIAGAASFGTEACHFQESGIPAVLCGPGSIAQAHQPNEFIDLEQIEACIAFMRKLKDWATVR